MTSIINVKLKPNAPIKIIMEILTMSKDNYPEGGIRDQFLAFRQEAGHLVNCLLVMATLRQQTRSAAPDRRKHEEALLNFIDAWVDECFELLQDAPASADEAPDQPEAEPTTPDLRIVQ